MINNNNNNYTCLKLEKFKNKRYRRAFIKRHLKNMILFVILTIMLVSLSIFIKNLSFSVSKDTFKMIIQRLAKLPIDIATILGLFYLIKAICGDSKKSSIILLICTFLFETINMIVYFERGRMLAYSDIYSLKTALNVSKDLDFNINWPSVIITIIFLIAIIFLFKFKRKHLSLGKELIRRVAYFAIGFTIILVLINSSYVTKEPFWNLYEEYIFKGTAYTLLRQISTRALVKPADYNIEEEEKLLENIAKQIEEEDIKNNKKYSEERPNIIVIMNESFADLYGVYNMGNRDSIPYFRSIAEGDNVISGTMYSGEFGGGTANVEYEFLTQNITSILPENSIAYNQFLRGNNESLVTNLENLGYDTYAFHSWYSSGYSRQGAYEFLDFNHKFFYEDYEDSWELTIHDFTKDSSTYEKVIKHVEEKEGPIFEFVITMENHRGYYRHNDIPEDDYVEDNEANCYLEQLTRTDEAIKILTDYINNMEEKTILVMFGDHQPFLEIMDSMDIKEEKKAMVPFFIYANYDIEEKHNISISPIYLANELYNILNFKKTPYMKFLEDLRKDIPVITKRFYIDNENNIYNISDENSKYYELIKELEKLTYYRMTH